MEEVFKTHSTGYQVSNLGRVRRVRGEGFKSIHKSNSGYAIVNLGSKTYYLHRVVAELFIGEIPTSYEVNHLNGDKMDARVVNLEIVTRSENQRHAWENGLKAPLTGETNAMSKVAEQSVLEMYDMMIGGADNGEIGRKFGLHSRYVSLIRSGRRWSHLFEERGMKGLIMQSPKLKKVSFKDRIAIMKDLTAGMRNDKVAEKYGIDKTTVSHVKRRKLWLETWEMFDSLISATTTEKVA